MLAPEHDLVRALTVDNKKDEVKDYISSVKLKSERDRQVEKNITGVFTGSYAIHPFTKEKIQIWISDYVLAGYGTGAVMAVPCGDQRDWDFANHFDIEIINIFIRNITFVIIISLLLIILQGYIYQLSLSVFDLSIAP